MNQIEQNSKLYKRLMMADGDGDSSVSIVTRLWAGRFGVRIPSQHDHFDSDAHPASTPIGTGAFSGDRAAGT
jgi:hypothetical protein